MAKIVKINETDFVKLLKETFKEVVNERSGKENSIKVFFGSDEISFLEELLDNLQADNNSEDSMIKKIRLSLSDAQVNS